MLFSTSEFYKFFRFDICRYMANGAARQKFEVREVMPKKGSSVLQIFCGKKMPT